MRKFWFVYLANALVVFPGGFGTMDELFGASTLIQTKKLDNALPIVLFGKSFWEDVINMEALVEHGTISAGDLDLFIKTVSMHETLDYIVSHLNDNASEKLSGFI